MMYSAASTPRYRTLSPLALTPLAPIGPADLRSSILFKSSALQLLISLVPVVRNSTELMRDCTPPPRKTKTDKEKANAKWSDAALKKLVLLQ